MTVNAIANAVAGYVQKITTGSQGSGQSAAIQEATETPAVTMKEAAHGDIQAIRKLAQEQQAQAMNSAPKTEPWTTVDHLT